MTNHTGNLPAFLAYLKTGTPYPLLDREEWGDMIRRTTSPGAFCEVEEETYDYFFDVLPPRWMGRGGFAFGEGADLVRLFWAAEEKYLSRQLTEEENAAFCRLAGIGLSSG